MSRFDKVLHRPVPFSSKGAAPFGRGRLPRRLARMAALLLLLGLPARAEGQLPPSEDWRTLETDHFRVTFPAGLEELARRAGERAERAWEALSENLVEAPSGVIDLVVTDHADVSNGFTQVFPSNRIVVFAPPPVDGFGLPFMDEWLELVVTHEVVHVFHEDYASGLGGILRRVFGRVPLAWPFFPAAATPGWTLEGMATYYESALTGAGRVKGTYHEMILRTALLENRFERIDQSSGDSPVWPGGERYYVYGSLFLEAMARRHGREALGAFVKATGGQWIPYRLDAAARSAFGVGFTEAWEEWRRELEARYARLTDTLAARTPLTVGEKVAGTGYYSWAPRLSPDGRWLAFARLDGRSDPQVRLVDLLTGEERKLTRTNSLANLSWTPGGAVLFSQIDHLDSYYVRGDLFLARPGGRVEKLTHGARLDHPDVAPRGDVAVAVQEGEGTSRLVQVDLGTGAVRPMNEYRPQTLWAYPRWSPDGRWIAVSRWRAGAYYDVLVLRSDGTVAAEVTRDRAVDQAPTWSPDGRWLVWASDRSGIPNLYAVEVAETGTLAGPVRQLTNVLTGAAFPAVSPDGEWLYYSAYHSDGWVIERIPFRPAEGYEPFPLDPRFRTDADPARLDRMADGEPGPYRPFPTLRPTYWAPLYRPPEDVEGTTVLKGGIGLLTSGEDLVGRHAYAFSGTFSGGPARFTGQGAYAYAGLGNPIFSIAASQSYDTDPRRWTGITPDQDSVPLFLVERERAVSLGATFLHRRSRSDASLSLAASHVWEERFFLEQDLQRSSRFHLSRPDVRLAEGRISGVFGNARLFAFSISPEDGVGLWARARIRRDLTIADTLRGKEGWDRSYSDLVGEARFYKGLRGPGFGNHVLGVRFSGGIAGGPGADAYHFEVGGAHGGRLPVQFISFGHGLLFPVRGYPTSTRRGRYAWSGTAEYRFPLWLVNRGHGLFPLHLDWMSGSLFLDGGNAWGPTLGITGYENPRRDPILSWGAEVTLRFLPLWFRVLDVRVGVAFPLEEGRGPQSYLRLGSAF